MGRGEDLTFDEIFRASEPEKRTAAEALRAKVNDPNRTMLGEEQEAWLAD